VGSRSGGDRAGAGSRNIGRGQLRAARAWVFCPRLRRIHPGTGTAATWVALTGMPPAASSFESAGVWRLHQLWVRGRRVLAGPVRAGSAFFWGARCGPKSLWFYISASYLKHRALLGRLKHTLPGWEEAESRRAADTAAEASCRPHASGPGARGPGADSWGAGHGGDVGRADRHACG
jgi:hypothetical protein